MGSEPRLHIRNLATSHLLNYSTGHKWVAGTVDERTLKGKGHDQDHTLFKVEWREKLQGNFANIVMIRTDKHPQKLLDATDLNYQTSGSHSGKKMKHERW